MPLVTASDPTRVNHPSDGQALLQSVSKALWIWDSLRLEIGELALVTDDANDGRLIALVATWYGASPVLFITDSAAAVPDRVTALPPITGGDEARVLTARLKERPSVAAVDLTGRTNTVEVLLETMPRFSRLLLAGTSREPLTIDYYVNVHRKGLRLVSAALDEPSSGLAAEIAARLERATRLLARPARLQACLDAVQASFR